MRGKQKRLVAQTGRARNVGWRQNRRRPFFANYVSLGIWAKAATAIFLQTKNLKIEPAENYKCRPLLALFLESK